MKDQESITSLKPDGDDSNLISDSIVRIDNVYLNDLIALVFYFEYRFKVFLNSGQSESLTLRIGFTTVHPKIASQKFINTRIFDKLVIGPKKSLDGKVQWKPTKMSVEEGKAIKNEDIHFTLNGLVTVNDALQPGEKEVIV